MQRSLITMFLIGSLLLLGGCGERDKVSGPTDGVPTNPTIELTAPVESATVTGSISLSAGATDAERVIFFIDQAEVGRDATAPYEVAWNSTTVANGAHRVKAVAESGTSAAADSVSITVSNGAPSAETAAVQGVFSLGSVIPDFGNAAVQSVAELVFLASGLNGNRLTTTGTLTHRQDGSDDFDYDPNPADHLVVEYPVDPSPTIVLHFYITAFEGDLSSDASDFEHFHSNLAFRIQRDNEYDLTITSISGTPPGVASPQTNIAYQRQLSGTRIFQGTSFTADLSLQGTYFFEVSGDFAEYQRVDAVTGNLASAGFTAHLSETMQGHILSNAGDGVTVSNNHRNADDSLTINGVTYGLSQIAIQTELTNGRIGEPDFWNAAGTLTRNGTVIGALRFASPPVQGGSHPGLVFDLLAGGVIPL